jgi:hypothetical protein
MSRRGWLPLKRRAERADTAGRAAILASVVTVQSRAIVGGQGFQGTVRFLDILDGRASRVTQVFRLIAATVASVVILDGLAYLGIVVGLVLAVGSLASQACQDSLASADIRAGPESVVILDGLAYLGIVVGRGLAEVNQVTLGNRVTRAGPE